jgi:hypothetical protein
MRDIADLPPGSPAGTANVLLHVARLSGAQYIEQAQPPRGMALNSFMIGLTIGALAAVAVMLS